MLLITKWILLVNVLILSSTIHIQYPSILHALPGIPALHHNRSRNFTKLWIRHSFADLRISFVLAFLGLCEKSALGEIGDTAWKVEERSTDGPRDGERMATVPRSGMSRLLFG